MEWVDFCSPPHIYGLNMQIQLALSLNCYWYVCDIIFAYTSYQALYFSKLFLPREQGHLKILNNEEYLELFINK